LNNKQYYYKNKPLSEEEFRKIEAEITDNLDNKLNDYLDEFKSIIRSRPKRFAKVLGSENSNGDNILYSKNCKDSFHMKSCENCRYCYGMEETKDAYDTSGFGIPSELLYECVNVGISSHNCAFIAAGYTLTNCYYCEHCYFSKNLFGCIGIRNHGEYFILNKKYSQEEYEELAATIAEEMTKNNEWGEFYPYELSSFGYNETLANLYYPLNKEGAIKLNAKWQDNLFEPQFSGENYRPVEINKYADDERERNLLLGGILQCEKTGRPFKIMPRELAFYIRNRLPIPKIHYEERFLERFKKMNPNELHHRQCMCEEEGHGHSGRCPNGFETTYAPNRPEKVYCEGCYQKSVI